MRIGLGTSSAPPLADLPGKMGAASKRFEDLLTNDGPAGIDAAAAVVGHRGVSQQTPDPSAGVEATLEGSLATRPPEASSASRLFAFSDLGVLGNPRGLSQVRLATPVESASPLRQIEPKFSAGDLPLAASGQEVLFAEPEQAKGEPTPETGCPLGAMARAPSTLSPATRTPAQPVLASVRVPQIMPFTGLAGTGEDEPKVVGNLGEIGLQGGVDEIVSHARAPLGAHPSDEGLVHVEMGASAEAEEAEPPNSQSPLSAFEQRLRAVSSGGVRLTVFESHGLVQVFAAAPGLSADAQDRLRRAADEAAAEFGLSISNFSLNGAPVEFALDSMGGPNGDHTS